MKKELIRVHPTDDNAEPPEVEITIKEPLKNKQVHAWTDYCEVDYDKNVKKYERDGDLFYIKDVKSAVEWLKKELEGVSDEVLYKIDEAFEDVK